MSASDAPEQPDALEIGTTIYGCHRCDELLDQVFRGCRSWFACPSCGWSDHPDDTEPGEWYQQRYSD